MNCKHCNTEMVKGTAIKHDLSKSPRGHCVCPNTENAVMVECNKCPECGYSTVPNAPRVTAPNVNTYKGEPLPYPTGW